LALTKETPLSILEEYEKFARGSLIYEFSMKMRGGIYEGHYFAYIQVHPFDICLKRSRAPNVPIEDEREFLNDDEIQDCRSISTFMNNNFKKNFPMKSYLISNVRISDVVEFQKNEVCELSKPLEGGSWRLYLPESPNFPAVDGILQGTIKQGKTTHEIIILDQVTVSSPKGHCSKKNDVGRMLLTQHLREQDDSKNQQDARDKFQKVFHRIETTENCHLFWKWTVKDPKQDVLDSHPLTDLGRTQSAHGPPDGMTAGYVTGKK